MITNDQIAVLLVIIIFLFGVVLAWIKIMSTQQTKENREFIDDLEASLKKESTETMISLKNEISNRFELMRIDVESKLDRTSKIQARMLETTKDLSISSILSLSKELQDNMHDFLKDIGNSFSGTNDKDIIVSIEKKLDEMHSAANEKLAKVLEDNLQKSFENLNPLIKHKGE